MGGAFTVLDLRQEKEFSFEGKIGVVPFFKSLISLMEPYCTISYRDRYFSPLLMSVISSLHATKDVQFG